MRKPMDKTSAKLTAQFNRVHLSLRDFEEAAEYLKAYRPRRQQVIKRALLLAAIVSYACPFSNNEREVPAKATSLLSVNLSRVLSSKELAMHQKLVNLRNEALAHSQYTRRPLARISSSESGFAVQGRLFDLLSESIDVEVFLALCEKMKGYCTTKLFELNRVLYGVENAP